VGEVKPVRVSRREIGHGALAEKALRPILPPDESFPFTLRVVAETMESNGSSSMAAVCGGCLALMDAGVPVAAPVAGVAMGLIKEGDEFIVLTDILGDEDALGDMDFKIAGTADGVTAVQMDIKVTGISTEIMAGALTQAREARLHILSEMAKALPAPRHSLSRYAPQHTEIEVSPEVIRLIIGPGGKNIKAITAETGASIDIDDSGKVAVFAPTQEAMQQAVEKVLAYDRKAELGKNYDAVVVKVLEVGCIVELLPNLEALVHVSQLDLGRVENVADFVKLGDPMTVKVIEINGDRVRASRKVVLQEARGMTWNHEETARPPRRGREERGGRDDRGGRGGRGERSGRDRR
jgi:polyribonucleotide nucleotidyltransferase